MASWLPSSSKVVSQGEGQTTRWRVRWSNREFRGGLLGLRRGLRVFRPIVVGGEGIGRRVEALRRHDPGGVFPLRVEHALEERVLRRFLLRHLVPRLEEG